MNKYTDDEELNKMFEQAFANEKSLTGDPELDTLFELAGTTFESVEADKLRKRQEWEETRKVILKKTLQDLSATNANISPLTTAGDIATGIGVSAREIGKFTFNALVDVADAAETYLKENGIGTGNIIDPSYKITDQVAIDAKKGLGSAGKVAYSLYNVVAPLSVGLATSGGSLAAGITADAAYSFLAQDPADPKLMDLFKGTDFQDLPIVADLMNKPYDTEMDGRIKNTVQSVALGSLIGGGIKLYQAKKASKIVNEIADNAEVAAARADDVINPATVGEPDNFRPTFGKPPVKETSNAAAKVDEAAPVLNKVDEAAADNVGAPNQDIIYHGTRAEFNEFDNRGGITYFTPDKIRAEHYAQGYGGYRPVIPKDETVLFDYSGDLPESGLPYDTSTNSFKGKDIDGKDIEIKFDDAIKQIEKDGGTYYRIGSSKERIVQGAYDKSKTLNFINSENPEGTKELIDILKEVKDKNPSNDFVNEILVRIKNTSNLGDIGSVFWPVSKHYRMYGEENLQEFVEAIKKRGYDSITFADDGAITVGIFDPNRAVPVLNKVDEAAPVLNKVDGAAPALDDAALAAEEESYKAFEIEAAKVEFFDTGVKTADDGTPRLSRFDVNNNYALNEIIASQADDTRAILYSPMSDTDLKLIAKAHQDDHEITERLLRWRQGDPALSNVEILVLKGHINNRAKDFNAAAAAFNPDDPASVLNFVESLNVYKHLDNVRKGASSASGAALRTWKLGPIMEGTDAKSWLKNLGDKGRANLIKKVIDQAGGIDSLKDLSDKIKIISQMPDSNFTYKMGEAEELSKFMRFEEAVTRVAVNGMLSSPATLIKAAVGNTLTAANLVIDDYILALSPTSKLTIKEANARLTGMMSSLVDALKFGVNAATDPMGYRGATRLDLDRGLAKSFDEKFLESGLTFIEKASTVLSAKDAPIRALIGLDAFTQHIVAQGHIRQKLLSEAMELGLKPSEITEYIAKGLENVDPKILAEAHQVAAETTLAKELTPELQGVADFVDEVTKYVRFKKVIFPFVRTNLNMIEQFAENSPLAALSPNFQRIMKTGDQLAKERAYAKVLRGSLQLGALTYLAATGNIQGVFTEDERVFVGKDLPQETSIKVGDRWVPVKDLPVIGPLTNIAALLSRMSGHLSDEQYSEAVMATTVYIGEVLTPQVLSEGVGGMVQLVTDPEKGMQWLSTIPTRFVPMSGALRDVTQTIDPNSRRQLEKDGTVLENLYNTLLNRYKAMIPGLSKELPPVISRYGESIKLPDGLPPAAINPFFTSGEAHLPHKRAMLKIMDYQKMYGDVLNVPELRLLQAPRSIEAAAFAEKLAPLAEQSFRMGELYKLTPMEYAVYQKYFAGFDPMADRPNVKLKEKMADGTVISSETLLEAETRVLKEYGMLNPDVELTPELYKKVVAQLHKVQIDFKSRADKLIKEYPSVREAMIEQMRKIQQFNDPNGVQ